jgi:gliding motility-associated-like protein
MAQVKVYATPVDESIDLLWKMGDGKSKRGIEVFYQYVDTGTYYITLEAKHNAGCSVEKQLGPIVVKAPEIFIPNVFTPNGDGNFDEFRINYTGDEAFYLVIYDRWGVTCFETYNKNQGWNGKDLNGMELREGVYFYSVRIGKYNDMGNITLLR